jgi:thiol-disulfide isomerase/thioredoxin
MLCRMEHLFNQYSYILISLIVIVASVGLLLRYVADRRIIAGAAAILITLSIAGHFLLRPGFSDVDTVSAAQATLRNGRPTMIEFFSNYCASCLALRPAVDLLVKDIKDEYNVLRIDIHTDFGRELRQNLQFTYTPEFVLFDTSGQEVWRGHTLPPRELLPVAKS